MGWGHCFKPHLIIEGRNSLQKAAPPEFNLKRVCGQVEAVSQV